MRHPVRTLAVLVVASGLAAGRSGAQASDVALGIEALARRDVRGADAAFSRGTFAANPALRPAAWQWRAHLAWKLRGDTLAAARYLGDAFAIARDSSQVLVEAARVAGVRRRYRDAIRTAYDAMIRSADAERRGLAARVMASLATDAAFAARHHPIADSLDRRLLTALRDTMSARVQRFPGRTVDARALIDVGAMLGDSAAVDAGLRSYFALGGPDLSAAIDSVFAPQTLVDRLIRGRLHESAALLLKARPPDGATSELADVLAYADFLRGLRQASEGVYRASLRGTARSGDLSRAVNAQGRALWRLLHWSETPPRFYPAALYRELTNRFGAVMSIERSGALEELHLAHRLGAFMIDASSSRAPVIVLDGVTASGIDAWLLDGAGGRAGWLARDTIFARRTSFTEVPFLALVGLTNPQSMPAEMLRIARDSAADLARARRDSLGYLPGVAARVFRAGAMAILDSLNEAAALSERERAAAFTRALYMNLMTTTIVRHESRHFVDAKAGRRGAAADDELRAKIDEVVGAPHPRLALTAILSPNIGDASAHGQANRRVMRGLARWIRRNGSSIAGYDSAMPALLHLPNLTDAQLIAAFSAMRPA
jgi:hypothetical protein